MKKLVFIIYFFIFVCMFISTNIKAQLPPDDPAYELVFSDDFNGNRLDSTLWLKTFPWHQDTNYHTFCHDTTVFHPMAAIKVRDANGNLDTTNCKVSNGTLKLITKKESYDGQCWRWLKCNPPSFSNCNALNYCDNYGGPNTCWHWDTLPFNFTTAMLYSKFNFRYGYFEIRFKLPPLPPSPKSMRGHSGTFWLYSGGNPYWSEIDVFEINANNNYCFAAGNMYWEVDTDLTTRHQDIWGPQNTHCFFTPDSFHTAAINWTSQSIEYYYDGILRWVSYNHPDLIHNMAIIINNGGNYTPTDNYCTAFDTLGADSTHFPYIFEIDYVKVWQLKKDCNTDINLTSFNPTIYPNKLHKSITMGTNVNITNQSNQTFWSQNYILLNEGTYVDNQSNVLFNVTNCNNIYCQRKINESAKGDENPTPPPSSFLNKLNNN
ncbi:MAG: family 16 glycosylhydrolase [Bacteroidales bacterium]|nr:family 16 glycosylhydrolase [Bacteroidales bacterium]